MMGYPAVEDFLGTFSRFDTTLQTDGPTHIQTDWFAISILRVAFMNATRETIASQSYNTRRVETTHSLTEKDFQ